MTAKLPLTLINRFVFTLTALFTLSARAVETIVIMDPYIVNSNYSAAPVISVTISYSSGGGAIATPNVDDQGDQYNTIGQTEAGSTGNGTNGKPCMRIVETGSGGSPPHKIYRIELSTGPNGGVYVQQITTRVVFRDGSVANIAYTEAVELNPNETYNSTHLFPDRNENPSQGSYAPSGGGPSQLVASVTKNIASVFVEGGSIPTTSGYNSASYPNGHTYTVDVKDSAGSVVGQYQQYVGSGADFSVKEGYDNNLFDQATHQNNVQVVERGFSSSNGSSWLPTLGYLTSDGNGC